MERKKRTAFLIGLSLLLVVIGPALSQAALTFALYGAAGGKVNWVSVPFNGTGISTTADLGNSIGAAFIPAEEDTIIIYPWNGADQVRATTTGIYVEDAWDWNPPAGYPVSVGAMYKVFIYRTEEASFEWTISGTVPPAGTVVFTLYDLSESNDNDNWISLPFDKGDLTTTVAVGESIAASFPEPEEDDTLTIALWNVATQLEDTTTGSYIEGEWSWGAGDAIATGMPFIVRPYHDGGITITWPSPAVTETKITITNWRELY